MSIMGLKPSFNYIVSIIKLKLNHQIFRFGKGYKLLHYLYIYTLKTEAYSEVNYK